jgi:hypothetical protein
MEQLDNPDDFPRGGGAHAAHCTFDFRKLWHGAP